MPYVAKNTYVTWSKIVFQNENFKHLLVLDHARPRALLFGIWYAASSSRPLVCGPDLGLHV